MMLEYSINPVHKPDLLHARSAKLSCFSHADCCKDHLRSSCNMMCHKLLLFCSLQVTAGSVLGIVSTGQDSLMSTTYTGPALPATTTEAAEASQQTGTYSNGMGQMQQQGRTGMQNGMMTGVQQQQQGTIGMQNGQMGAGNPYTAATSSASKVSARTGVMTVLLGGLFLALGL